MQLKIRESCEFLVKIQVHKSDGIHWRNPGYHSTFRVFKASKCMFLSCYDSLLYSNFKRTCLSRPYLSYFFKGCLPQILLGPFLNILSHVVVSLFRKDAPTLLLKILVKYLKGFSKISVTLHLQHHLRCFPANFAKYFPTTFLIYTSSISYIARHGKKYN